MEVSGIDPEIVAGQQVSLSNGADAQGVAQGGNMSVANANPHQSPKNELDVADPNHDISAATAHMMNSRNSGFGGQESANAQQNAAAAALAANQYAQAATYGAPVPVQPNQSPQIDVAHGRVGKRRVRLGWSEEETRNLMEGCKRHGVGNWKKILTDPSLHFNCRTAVDLKDRFRTSFPEEYSRLYPNARTHKVKRLNGSNSMPTLVKVSRKERRAFSPDEDERLLQGFLKHGPAWSKIQRDASLGLSDRRSTDLRDRFRNAFPDRYTAAGYKGRTHGGKTPVGGSDLPISSTLDDELVQQGGMLGGRNAYMPNAVLQQLQYQQQYPQSGQYTQGQRTNSQQYNNQQQAYQQQAYQQPAMFYGVGMNTVPLTNMNQLGQVNPQVNAQMRQVPQMNMGHMGVWPNQQQ